MTLDDFAEKMDKRFDQVDDKLDMINMTVAKHTVSLTGHDREIKELKDSDKEKDGRISKLEKWMWFNLGAGGAAGVLQGRDCHPSSPCGGQHGRVLPPDGEGTWSDLEPMKTEGVQCRNCRYCDHNQSWCKVKAQSVRVLSVRDCRMYRRKIREHLTARGGLD